ncbi:MAG: cation efflux protein [Dehalococcoidales bacterium]|nr:cation efflux protein [Dehalococcoidales bacterium]
MTEGNRLSRQRLRRWALLLVWIGELWNVLEAGVALWAAKGAGSVALLAYGLDSLIELFAGGVLIWHLSREWRERGHEEAAEKKALKLVGVTFFLLSAYIIVQSTGTLLGWFAEPRESMVGIILVVASAMVMTAIFFPKLSLAKKLGSRALRGEAIESLVCDLQDLTLLVGLGANVLWGWWWADPVAALALVPWLVKEGWESVFQKEEE